MSEDPYGLFIPISVEGSSDLKIVERIAYDVAKEILTTIPGGMKDFDPIIRYKEINSYNITITVIMKTKTYFDSFSVKHEFIRALDMCYKQASIKIIPNATSVVVPIVKN